MCVFGVRGGVGWVVFGRLWNTVSVTLWDNALGTSWPLDKDLGSAYPQWVLNLTIMDWRCKTDFGSVSRVDFILRSRELSESMFVTDKERGGGLEQGWNVHCFFFVPCFNLLNISDGKSCLCVCARARALPTGQYVRSVLPIINTERKSVIWHQAVFIYHFHGLLPNFHKGNYKRLKENVQSGSYQKFTTEARMRRLLIVGVWWRVWCALTHVGCSSICGLCGSAIQKNSYFWTWKVSSLLLRMFSVFYLL